MSGPFISSIRIRLAGMHAHFDVWARGGHAGTLVVDRKDAVELADMLRRSPDTSEWWFDGKERLPPRDCWPCDLSLGEGKNAGRAPTPVPHFSTMPSLGAPHANGGALNDDQRGSSIETTRGAINALERPSLALMSDALDRGCVCKWEILGSGGTRREASSQCAVHYQADHVSLFTPGGG